LTTICHYLGICVKSGISVEIVAGFPYKTKNNGEKQHCFSGSTIFGVGGYNQHHFLHKKMRHVTNSGKM